MGHTRHLQGIAIITLSTINSQPICLFSGQMILVFTTVSPGVTEIVSLLPLQIPDYAGLEFSQHFASFPSWNSIQILRLRGICQGKATGKISAGRHLSSFSEG